MSLSPRNWAFSFHLFTLRCASALVPLARRGEWQRNGTRRFGMSVKQHRLRQVLLLAAGRNFLHSAGAPGPMRFGSGEISHGAEH
jgi:hypothetical protein